MTAIMHQGLGHELDIEAPLLREIVARRVVDKLRSFSSGTTLEVARTETGIETRQFADPDTTRQRADRGMSFDITYEEWQRHFSDHDILVPNLRVRRYASTFTNVEAARWALGSESVSLVRLEDALAYASRTVGFTTEVPEADAIVVHAHRLLQFCHHRELIARIRL